MLTAFGAGCAIAPLVAGFAAQHLGFARAFVALGVTAAIGLVVWLVGSRRGGLEIVDAKSLSR